MIQNSDMSDQSCFSKFIDDSTSAFGYYTTEKEPDEISFPNVTVTLAEKTQSKKDNGPNKFFDNDLYSECDECAIKVDGLFLVYGSIGTTLGVVVGAGIGGGIGAAAGGCTPPGIAAGVVVGGVVGGVVGNRIGVYLAKEESFIAIKECDEYTLWNEARIEKTTKKMLMQYCSMYFAQDLICPITGMLPAFPVFANNQIYEKDAIEEWLDSKKAQEKNIISQSRAKNISTADIRKRVIAHRKTVCPMQGPYFDKTDLICDEDAIKKIYQCLRSNLEEINATNDNLQYTELKKLFVALVKNKTMIVQEKVKKATLEMNRFHIKQEYQDKVVAQLLNSV